MKRYCDIGMSPDYGRPEERVLPEPDEDIPEKERQYLCCKGCGVLYECYNLPEHLYKHQMCLVCLYEQGHLDG